MSGKEKSIRGEELTSEDLQFYIAKAIGEFLAEKRGEIIERAMKEIDRARGELGKEAEKLD